MAFGLTLLWALLQRSTCLLLSCLKFFGLGPAFQEWTSSSALEMPVRGGDEDWSRRTISKPALPSLSTGGLDAPHRVWKGSLMMCSSWG
ncbi:hypothetical protein B0T14DRAFT_279256 [Immersiella caudata]|uniref:Secreted protein n=1 Tax=Immersiella caudata TaxID=314043 RepID=A0AA39WDK4_9PEZI|nr:hypothetical protein B0T14DRAFT_279256 [Immersiella caudata]